MKITKQTRNKSYLARPITRQEAILTVLGDNLMTAREIAEEMGYPDMNAVRPRLTELQSMGKIESVGIALDEKTQRRVAVWRTIGDE